MKALRHIVTPWYKGISDGLVTALNHTVLIASQYQVSCQISVSHCTSEESKKLTAL